MASQALGCALFVVALALVACGGGGSGGDGGGGSGGGGGLRALVVDSTTPPSAQIGLGCAYTASASGGTPPYTFGLAPGSDPLPVGLSISPSGRVSGTPTVRGDSRPRIEVVDSTGWRANAVVLLRVGEFDVGVEGLEDGEAWTGTTLQVRLTSSPLDTLVAVSVLPGGSGATAAVDDPAPAISSIRVGAVPVEDTVRVTSSTGATSQFVLPVVPHPAPTMAARYGTTDVWAVRYVEKAATHAYATDFDDALATLGLRAPASVSALGTKADRLARLLVRKRSLQWLGTFFGLAADGSPALGSVAISFPLEQPLAPAHAAPAAGTQAPATPGAVNWIGVHYGPGDGSWGLSFIDDALNSNVENLSTAGGTRRGAFLEGLVPRFNTQYANTVLPASPVADADAAALDALVNDLGPTDARSTEIERIADGFAKVLGAVLAHEIGHALSLSHRSTDFSIMNPSALFGFTPITVFGFAPADMTTLRAIMPGPGR